MARPRPVRPLHEILDGLLTALTEEGPLPLWFTRKEAARRLGIGPEKLRALGQKYGGVFAPIQTIGGDKTTRTRYFLEQLVLISRVDLGFLPRETAHKLWEIVRRRFGAGEPRKTLKVSVAELAKLYGIPPK